MALLTKYHSDDQIRKVRYDGHVERGEKRGTCRFLVGKLRKRGHLEGVDLDKGIILI
jgi:hypothetical protein